MTEYMNNSISILKISYELSLSHIGSNLSALNIYEEIYYKKKPEDIVISDAAHNHLAHLVVMDSYCDLTVIEPTNIDHMKHIIKDYGIHCDRQAGCDASGGSLGHGIGIGIGYALANRERNIYVIVSDGSMMEGSNWEALRLMEKLGINNIYIYCNFNSYTAVDKIDIELLRNKILAISGYYARIKFINTNNGISFLNGLNGHYDILTEETYQKALKELDENEKLARDLT